jgi:hypothetical protein
MGETGSGIWADNLIGRLRAESQIPKEEWYVQPVVFAGDPSVGENLTWVNHEDHAQAVKWWNDQYRQLKGTSEARPRAWWLAFSERLSRWLRRGTPD